MCADVSTIAKQKSKTIVSTHACGHGSAFDQDNLTFADNGTPRCVVLTAEKTNSWECLSVCVCVRTSAYVVDSH